MDIIIKVSGEEALYARYYLRRAQHSKAELPALCLRAIRQAVKAQAKIELEALQRDIEAALPGLAECPSVADTSTVNEATE